MNKEFIPYGKALTIEELGYDGDDYIAVWYHSAVGNTLVLDGVINDYDKWCKVPALTYSQAFRWFRDKKLCDGSVCRHGEADGGYLYRWDIVYEYGVYEERHFKQGYETYEEAELACLNELIEIVKNK